MIVRTERGKKKDPPFSCTSGGLRTVAILMGGGERGEEGDEGGINSLHIPFTNIGRHGMGRKRRGG